MEQEPVPLEQLVKNKAKFQQALGRDIKIGKLCCTSKCVLIKDCDAADYYWNLDFQIGTVDPEEDAEYESMPANCDLANEAELH